MPLSPAEKQARYRERKAGLKRVEVWVPKSTEQQVRELAEKLREEHEK